MLDTGVLVRANARSKGPARELLTTILGGPHTLVSSPFLLAEAERVMYYPRLRELLRLTDHEIREHLDLVQRLSEVVEAVVAEPVVLSDPDDDPVVYTAVTGRADALCTLDQHLRHPSVAAFCARRGISVLTDVELRRVLRS
ncbi:MAG: putative toxin-antitoxin system toxin component, PIN family [Bryobacterales bacterium]